VQSQQLLTKSEILEEEILSGPDGTDSRSQEMTERRDDDQDHGRILSKHAASSPSPSRSFCECTRF